MRIAPLALLQIKFSAWKAVAIVCDMFSACFVAASALATLSITMWRSDQGTWLSRDPEAPLPDGGGSVER